MTPTIDLNADVGEDPTPEGIARDAAMAEHITSLNIACGGHAGDAASMTRLVRLAREHNLNIGAHPSYPDRANFGRTELPMSPAEIERSVEEQVRSLLAIVQTVDPHAEITHIKPHGALYHAARKPDIAKAIARAGQRIAPHALLVGQYGSPALDTWRDMGCHTATEAFADRLYEPDGTLRARTKPGALIEDPARVVAQAVQIARDRTVVSASDTILPLHAATLCLHSDTPGAANLAKAVRQGLVAQAIQVTPLRHR